MGIELYEIYTLTDHIASARHELFAGTKVRVIGRHKLNRWDVECIETGICILCVNGEDLE